MVVGKGKLRRWPFWVVAVTALVMAWVLYVVWRSHGRDDLATYGAFAVAVVIVFPGLLAWARRRSAGDAAAGEELDRVVEDLARAVRAQWEKAAGERGLTGADPIRVTWSAPSLAMAGPSAAAVSSQRFAPLPGLPPAGMAQLTSGDAGDMHALYGGLGSGRLIIAGPPGAGKSGAAVLLILAALRYRDQVPAGDKAKIPVPLLVTAQDWDPGAEPVDGWLARQLRAAYPLFSGPSGAALAEAVIAAGRIAVIVDGLDEIAEDARPVALRALSQQAFRMVILSRTTEMAAAAARHGILQGAAAVELQPVVPAEAVGYLERVQLDPPPDGWRELTGHLRDNPAGPLSKALNKPLTLTLLRDTCQTADDVRALLAFCGTLRETPDDQAVEEITDYLLDRVLPAAYARRPGQPPPPYDLATAQHALAIIAARMNQDGSRDLQWWGLSAWVSPARRAVACGMAGGLAVGLVAGLAAGLAVGIVGGLAVGAVIWLVFGIVYSRAVRGERMVLRVGRLQPRRALTRRSLLMALVCGLGIGVVVWLAAGLASALAAGLGMGVAVVLAMGVPGALAADDDGSSLSPLTSWRHDRNFGLIVGFVAALALAVPGGLVVGIEVGPALGLDIGISFGLTAGIVTWLDQSEIWILALSSALLARELHTPVRLLSFLDDAHNRNVLRTVGPAYQFRHARLQDRLAATASPDAAVASPEKDEIRLPRLSAAVTAAANVRARY